MKINVKSALITTLFLSFLSILVIYPYRRQIIEKLKYYLIYHGKSGGNGECPGCSTIFTDNVAKHEKAFEDGEGILPQEDEDGLEQLLNNKTLVELKSSNLYLIRPSRFSWPYILPEGEQFIRELGKIYYSKCMNDKTSYVPFTITSITRTKKSVKELMKNNGNAIENSAHLKGKTFDVSYRAFDQDKIQTKHFITALQELRLKQKCFVKYERNGCLHITIN